MPDALTRHWRLPGFMAKNPDAPVAYRAGTAITFATFVRDATAARQALSRLGQRRIALFEPDIYAFSVWLMAAWSLGVHVILPGDDLATTREALDFPWVGQTPDAALRNWRSGGRASPDTRDFGAPALFLSTSGSTGAPCLIEKTLRQLRREIEALNATFGGHLATGKDIRFVRSVPHQHMYGLPFAVLWPLTFGYPIVGERLQYPDDIWRLPAAGYVLVSAPTFLRHLSPSADADAPDRADICWQLATSAGSPLPPGAQARCRRLLNAPLFEIYGSTETGAAAHRQDERLPWQPLSGVRLSVDADTSRLRIHSPFLAAALEKTGFLSNDLARIDARGLELLGRADRVIKIGEKRISLGQVETALMALPDVERAVVLPRRGARETLGAVVILTPDGRTRRENLGKARFDRFLRGALRDRVEAIALPRRWRYVTDLPTNDMGKTTRRDLEGLFAPTLPRAQCLRQDQNEDGHQALLQLYLDTDLVWFDGHFPELPVLPGVTQIDWAVHFARLHFGVDLPVSRMIGLKFQRLIRPGDTPRLALTWRPGKRELEFAYTLDETRCSRGTLVSGKG
ncbi:MAG: AMP-binding protein [Zoogloeaceae bacterium]|jgi:acyl-coenzyme A synthetase/AMP-(fatty) acid ligase/3-hydroxymyristoyl/3-hydroxydecanoyl-(acyl carrier protein) dehydratase|nr:AMP-binding protein [Zoogloeaceae bacterium]